MAVRLELEQSEVAWVCITVVVIVCWQLTRYALRSYSKSSSAMMPEEAVPVIDEDDYPDLVIPNHPHMEMAIDTSVAPGSSKGLLQSNAPVPCAFENEYCKGKLILIHPPTKEGVDKQYANYFKGKQRRWEWRVQFEFKEAPAADADLCFGIELDEYVPMNAAVKRAQSCIVAAIKSAVGGVYHSCGDEPASTTGELEKPCCVLPLWAFDQFIVTPEGEEPPSLIDPNFQNMGQKRSKRIKAFCQELDDVKKNFKVGATYSFASWGVSKFLDIINWRLIGIPVVTPLDFDKLAGSPPVFVALYCLRPGSRKEDARHVQSRKQYYFRTALWSSLRRPQKHRFEALTGSSNISEPLVQGTIQKESGSFWSNAFACCTTRPRELAETSLIFK